MVCPDLNVSGYEARFAERTSRPRLQVRKYLFLGRVGADYDVDMVASYVESQEIPPAKLARPPDRRVHSLSFRGSVQHERRVLHDCATAPKETVVSVDARCSEVAVLAINRAARVAVKPCAVRAEREEVDWAGHGARFYRGFTARGGLRPGREPAGRSRSRFPGLHGPRRPSAWRGPGRSLALAVPRASRPSAAFGLEGNWPVACAHGSSGTSPLRGRRQRLPCAPSVPARLARALLG